jgi:hypothetical protein
MNRFELEKMKRKYAEWLPRYCVYSMIESITESTITEETMSLKALCEGATGSMVGIDSQTSIFLIDSKGEFLARVKPETQIRHNEAHEEDEYEEGHTVGETLFDCEPGDVHYVVVEKTGYDIRGHFSVGGYDVIIYTVDDFKPSLWFAEKMGEYLPVSDCWGQ